MARKIFSNALYIQILSPPPHLPRVGYNNGWVDEKKNQPFLTLFRAQLPE